MVEMNRRGFFKLALGAAALVTVPKSIMAALPQHATIYADGINCDVDGLEALFRGEPVEFAKPAIAKAITIDGRKISMRNATFLATRTLKISGCDNFTVDTVRLIVRHDDTCVSINGGASFSIDELYLLRQPLAA